MARTTFSGPVASDNGFIQLSDNGKGVTIKAPAALAADYVLTLPVNDGSNNQFLKTDGSGVLSWAAGDGTGTVTSVGGTGTVNGLSLSGTVTTSGDLTLGGNFVLPATAVADLEDIANAINTTGKYTGKMAVVLATGLIFTATGSTAGSAWKASDGTTTATPI